ncbi:hydroxymethylbilane synthase [Thermaurantimonas aggregans]|uniref:Hydroxymethylbilane synthase n=1 Tax=Thermaurantimonas aggregans TaxID=2173829 RepID=A0A401XKD1_9FLAO|nr:hydroxymethylbilane synthase [Thermaurantimonas aggregans]MCX8148357.1 hydroxymethylbilane synthase [Thermaurantimonas aggregans]GCD77453.1 hydroxymethylbilane synthase [Thermaurantimonas aggregans]
MNNVIRIGTRDSRLALWQAEFVAKTLQKIGIPTEIIPVKSQGDINLTTPLYEMGIQGIFTKTLDVALIENKIDIAVHSYKDVPTTLPKGLVIAAVPERGNYTDSLVSKKQIEVRELFESKCIIATGSVRRKAQWLHSYPHHHIEPLRGNVLTRLQKLETHGWDGAIFASAGLQRLEIKGFYSYELPFLPAPGQGALAIVAREEDEKIRAMLEPLHHSETGLCVSLEKTFLKTLEGGCSAPIACLATVENKRGYFRGEFYELKNFSKVYTTEFHFSLNDDAHQIVKNKAIQLLKKKKNYD